MRQSIWALFALFSCTAQAASVYGIAQDDLQMGTLGEQYIHSRHIGLMPYWGPCDRCSREAVCSPQPYPKAASCAGPINGWATGEGTYAPDAQWIYGTDNCRNAQSDYSEYLDTFYQNNTATPIVATAWYAMNDFGGLYINGVQECTYSDAGHTGNGAYPSTGGLASCQITLPVGTDTVMIRVTNGGGSSYGILQVDYNSQAIITTNPNTWYYVTGQCPQEYQRVCRQYAPTSAKCQTPPDAETLEPSAYSWACQFTGNPEIGGWYQDICQNSYVTNSQAQWIFGASDGATGTAQSGYSVMQASFDNTLGTISANLTFLADNIGWVWLNGQQVAYGNWSTQSTNPSPWSGNITVPAGNDTIDFMVMNYPDAPVSDPTEYANPSLGILSLTAGTGQVLISSNASDWYLATNSPTPPDPSPQSLLAGTGYTAQNCASGGC